MCVAPLIDNNMPPKQRKTADSPPPPSDLLLIRTQNEALIQAQHLALQQIPGQIVGPLIYCNPPQIVNVNPNIDLTNIPVNKHAPTFGPVRPPLTLKKSPTNLKKIEPIPLALHFPATFGEMTEALWASELQKIIQQFWVNEKAAVRALPGIGSVIPPPSGKTKKPKGGSKKIGLDTPGETTWGWRGEKGG